MTLCGSGPPSASHPPSPLSVVVSPTRCSRRSLYAAAFPHICTSSPPFLSRPLPRLRVLSSPCFCLLLWPAKTMAVYRAVIQCGVGMRANVTRRPSNNKEQKQDTESLKSMIVKLKECTEREFQEMRMDMQKLGDALDRCVVALAAQTKGKREEGASTGVATSPGSGALGPLFGPKRCS